MNMGNSPVLDNRARKIKKIFFGIETREWAINGERQAYLVSKRMESG